MPRYRSTTASISLLALALAGCNKSAQDMTAVTASPSPDSGLPALPAALPMQTGPATSLTTAPPVAALPVRRFVNVARPANDREAYAYLDRASDIEDEIGDAPPDYDYDDDGGVSPYVWQTHGGDYRYAEPVDGGGYRYYYYQPGAEYPYLVRTHDYSYAYAGAALVAIYALSGALLSPDRYGGYRDQASRYFSRGQQLRQASNQREHQGVIAANWAAQRAQFSAAQANWAADRAQQADWQAYHARNDPSQQPGWQQEHQQRQQVAQQFSGWQSRGFNGSPPPALAAGSGAGAPRPHVNSPPPVPAGTVAGRVAGNPEQHGFAGPAPTHPHNEGGPQGRPVAVGQNQINAAQVNATQANASREQLAAQKEAQHQAEISQRMAQEAQARQRRATMQQEAATRDQERRKQIATEQTTADAHRQRELAAQQEAASRESARTRDAQGSAQQAQLHAMAAQHQAETARMQEPREHPENIAHERPQSVPAPRERAPEPPRPPETRPAATHETPHSEPAHPEPGHSEPGHEHDHDHQ